MMALIKDEQWNSLEIAARRAAVAGGTIAMEYYREALATPEVLEKNINPTTIADMQATLAILHSLNRPLDLIASNLNFGLSFFAEELARKPSTVHAEDPRESHIRSILAQLSGNAAHIKRNVEAFQQSLDHSIAILFDAIDGTTNFRAGIPFFCSAVAFFLGGTPRVAAIYDPIHNVVYCGSIRDDGGNSRVKAYIWHLQSGSRTDLGNLKNTKKPNRLIAIHLTRSRKDKRNELIEQLNRLTTKTGGMYIFNSGQLALAYVAHRNLSAFVNNYTNIWDVAAGEVLVRAAGGVVTNFQGKPINYGGDIKVNVVASSDQALHDEVLKIMYSSTDCCRS
jgi:myo-inositol-1(or 4)-monophosphatase